jgi:hypothetical protein
MRFIHIPQTGLPIILTLLIEIMSWITDRLPTAQDSYNGWVQIPPDPFLVTRFHVEDVSLRTTGWNFIKLGEPWYYHLRNQP